LLVLSQVRIQLIELSHLATGSPTQVMIARLAQVEMRDVLEATSHVEARGELVRKRLIVDKAVCSG
jgi:hypothetical protein